MNLEGRVDRWEGTHRGKAKEEVARIAFLECKYRVLYALISGFLIKFRFQLMEVNSTEADLSGRVGVTAPHNFTCLPSAG